VYDGLRRIPVQRSRYRKTISSVPVTSSLGYISSSYPASFFLSCIFRSFPLPCTPFVTAVASLPSCRSGSNSRRGARGCSEHPSTAVLKAKARISMETARVETRRRITVSVRRSDRAPLCIPVCVHRCFQWTCSP